MVWCLVSGIHRTTQSLIFATVLANGTPYRIQNNENIKSEDSERYQKTTAPPPFPNHHRTDAKQEQFRWLSLHKPSFHCHTHDEKDTPNHTQKGDHPSTTTAAAAAEKSSFTEPAAARVPRTVVHAPGRTRTSSFLLSVQQLQHLASRILSLQ